MLSFVPVGSGEDVHLAATQAAAALDDHLVEPFKGLLMGLFFTVLALAYGANELLAA